MIRLFCLPFSFNSNLGGASDLPATEDGKAFYALGINVAQQVGGELKNVLTKDELEHVIAGFKASLLETVTNENEVLATHGRRLNEILNKRMSATLDTEKAKGSDYLEKYLKENPSAKKLASGLVYHETVPGLGQQVRVSVQPSIMPLTISV